MLILWIVASWVIEFSIMILFVHNFLSSLTDLDELGKMLSVGEVLVEVILHMLDQVHMLLNKVVSSYSREREGLVVQFPSMDSNLWVLSLFLKFSIDLHEVVIVLHVEVSGEIIQLDVKLFLRNLKCLCTRLSRCHLLKVSCLSQPKQSY